MKLKNTFLFLFSALTLSALTPRSVLAQAKENTLKWAADTESGAPYVFHDPEHPEVLKGFEYDLVLKIAEKLHRHPIFVQNAWDGLIPGLSRRDYDIAINGIEITEDRKKEVLFSDPYFATGLKIVVKSGDPARDRLSDLKGLKVGTLSGALSERILKSEEGVEVLLYDSESLAHEDLLNGRSQALLFDAPIVKYYSEVDPRFHPSASMIGSLQYGIVATKSSGPLMTEINQALRDLQASGELREIYEKWALWNPQAAVLFNDFTPSRLRPDEYEKFKIQKQNGKTWKERLDRYLKALPSLAAAAGMTLKLSVLSMLIAILLGLVILWMRLSKIKMLVIISTVFIELIRGTPLLLQFFLLFYALPTLGLELTPFIAAILGLGINYSVQEAEIYRGGLRSVHPHQIEAARVLGLSPWKIFWLIQVPQALNFCLPPMTTDFIALIKDSSLVSIITLVELTKMSSVLSSTYYDYLGFGLIAAGFYLLIGLPFVLMTKYFERRQS